MINKKQISYDLAQEIIERIKENLLDEGIDIHALTELHKDDIDELLIETILDLFKEYGVV